MTLQEFKEAIKNKTFRLTDTGFLYEFIPENTLRLKDTMSHSVHYEITEQNGYFILHHNNFFGTEPIKIELIPNTSNRLELTLTTIFSGKFVGTWIEEQDRFHF